MLRHIFRCRQGLNLRACSRSMSDTPTSTIDSNATEGESKLKNIIEMKFPQHKMVKVEDVSGGCGAMYEVHIEAEEFRGMKTLKQHMIVNKALETEIKDMHGLRIFTTVPE